MPWKPGESGNPKGGGRPKGRRDAITQAFLNDLEACWRENGVAALKAAATEKPAEFTKMVASLLPKQVEIERPLAEMGDDELAELVSTIREAIAAANKAGGGASVSDGEKPPADVPALH